ncbi:molybdopterin molybdotransferase MoeA [Alicyclobacillus dauci]|uniref:Molybdopterin molybdenumtransferase n=1 Tax=Alicyclobacillus dauci TaxID=1475485 RepID=A0ABY6Z6H9_9BACL|nr:molybdopterin molybdotransferase MoeA [Alicyclobacillus dauci]WAH38475.1 molybdopterin molybdotransferase MoeA [Alicyclobacillus dauci]
MTHVSTYDEALETVIALAAPCAVTDVDVWASLDRHARIAEAVRTGIDLPPFHRSMMDGYAVHQADLDTQAPLAIVDDIRAGESPRCDLSPGKVAKVRTGAPVPNGAAAVVRQEWVDVIDDKAIRIVRPVRDGESIQPAGEDAKAGHVILEPGSVLDPQTQTILRAAGIGQVRVYKPCRVAIIATGSELVSSVNTPLQRGQIYAASDAFLAGAVRDAGATVTDIAFIQDDLRSIEQAITAHLGAVDYILLTGGASVGDTDFVKAAVRNIAGVDQLPVERVWMRPGSPFIAARAHGTTIFGMSGNPAACFVQFHVLALHAIRRTLGHPSDTFPLSAILSRDLAIKPVKHVRFHRGRARLDGTTLVVEPQLNQSSGILSGLSSVNAIIRLDQSTYQKGETVPLLFTRNPLVD